MTAARRRRRDFSPEDEQAPPPIELTSPGPVAGTEEPEAPAQESVASAPAPAAAAEPSVATSGPPSGPPSGPSVPDDGAAPPSGTPDTWPDLTEQTPGSMGMFRNAVTDILNIEFAEEWLKARGVEGNAAVQAAQATVAMAAIGRYARQYGVQEGLTLPEGETPIASSDVTPTEECVGIFRNPKAARDFVSGSWLADRLTGPDGTHPFKEGLDIIKAVVTPEIAAAMPPEALPEGLSNSAPGNTAPGSEGPGGGAGPGDDGAAPSPDGPAVPPPQAAPPIDYVSDEHRRALSALEASRRAGLDELQAIVDEHRPDSPLQDPAAQQQGGGAPPGLFSGIGAGIGAVGKGIGALLSLPKTASQKKAVKQVAARANIVYGRSYQDLMNNTTEAFQLHRQLDGRIKSVNAALESSPEGSALINDISEAARARFGNSDENGGGLTKMRALLHGPDRSPEVVGLRDRTKKLFEETPGLGSTMLDIEMDYNKLNMSMMKVEDGLEKLERNGATLPYGDELRHALGSMDIDNPKLSPPGSRMDELKEQVQRIAKRVAEAAQRLITRLVNAFTGGSGEGHAGPAGP